MTVLSAVVLDLDGVVRHFDPDRLAAIEVRHGLEAGLMWSTAFSPELIQPLVTGRLGRAEWSLRIGEIVGCPEAAAEWQADIGQVDEQVLAVVDETRRRGLPCAILTNGTDTVPGELRQLGIADRFDRIFNSAEIGVAKPDPRIYHHVCWELGLEPGAVFFADDSAGHVEGATAVGLVAHRFVDAPTLRAELDHHLGRPAPPAG